MQSEINKSTLEFIQMTYSVEFIPNSRLLALLLGEVDSTKVENIRQIHSIMQNEPNFRPLRLENDDLTKKRTQYEPNLKPILAHYQGYEPKRSQFFQ